MNLAAAVRQAPWRSTVRCRALSWSLIGVTALTLTGCTFNGATSFPLPGGVGGNGYQVQIEFTDVLDLVPQSAVKVNDVTVGTVKDITVVGYIAHVTVSVKRDVVLPANATASLRQTSLLGEKFVSLDRPVDAAATGTLREGDLIPLARTRRNADLEEVLGALSLILNGGGLEQLQVINSELTKALKGREPEVKDFLRQLNGFVGGLDQQKAQIVKALDGLDRLTSRLAAQRQTLDVALRDIPQGVAVLADERAQLTAVLGALSKLGNVATRVITATQQNTVADLQALQPILTQLGVAGKDLPNALELLTTYPFPRTVGATPGKQGGIRGAYANLFVTVDGNIMDLLGNLTGGSAPPLPVPLPLPKGGVPVPPVQRLPVPTVPTLPNIPGLSGLTGGLATGEADLAQLLFGGLS